MSCTEPADVFDALDAFADYEETQDVGRAQKYVTACRRFLSMPTSQADQGSSLGYTPDSIRAEMRYAQSFIRMKSGNNSRTLVQSDYFLGRQSRRSRRVYG